MSALVLDHAEPCLSPVAHRALERAGLAEIRDKVVAGERLTYDDGTTQVVPLNKAHRHLVKIEFTKPGAKTGQHTLVDPAKAKYVKRTKEDS